VHEGRAAHRWIIDLPVSALTLLFTAGTVIKLPPGPIWALVNGTGIGAAGALLIGARLAWVKRCSGLFEPHGAEQNGS
jgi:hypothetical protein